MPYGKYSRKRSRGASRKPSRFSTRAGRRKKSRKGPPTDLVVTRPFTFWATASGDSQDGLGLCRSNKLNFVVSNLMFNIALIPGVAAFEAIYEYYRIDWCELTFIPTAVNYQVDDTDVGTSASTISKSTPSIYVARFYGTEDNEDCLFADENSALLSGAKPRSMGKPFKFTFKPNTINVGAQSTRTTMDAAMVNPVYQKEYGKWLQFGENYAPTGNRQYANYYGIKWGISANTSDTAEWCMKIMCKFRISFKNYNGNSSNNIALVAETVVKSVG